MKKNGFIATSLIYSFFLVFIAVITALVGSYLSNKNMLNKFNSDIIEDMNAHYEDIFVTNGSGGITGLTDYGKTLNSIKIPKYVGTEEITEITYDSSYSYDFCEGAKFKTLDLGHLTSLGEHGAFQNPFEGCNNLKVVLGNNIQSLDGGVFARAENLTSISMPNLTYIGNGGAFMYCSNLKKIDLSKVTFIGFEAFHGCTSLEKVDLSSVVNGFDEYSFNGCTSLTEITFNDSIIDIYRGAPDYIKGYVFGVPGDVPLKTTIYGGSEAIKNFDWLTYSNRDVTFID